MSRDIRNCRRLHPAAEKGWPARYRDVGMSPSRLYVPAGPAKPTSCPCH